MTVNVTKPQINLREKLSEVDKPSGIAGEAILRSETPQEVFNYIGAGRRNLIINGAMQVAQRSVSATMTNNGYDALDRWRSSKNAGNFVGNIAMSADAPDGFATSLKITTTTPEASVAGAEYMTIRHRIEATSLQQLAYGTSNAKSVAVSFYVKSSEAGQYSINLYSPDGNRIITASYSINSADTWEYKSLVFSGDQSGTITNDTGNGLEVCFVIAAGTDYTSSDSTSWGAYSNAKFAYGHEQNAVFTTTGASWQVTGVQLELGKVATPFEHRSYGEELALCQRYYYQKTFGNSYPALLGGSSDGSNVFFNIYFPTTMRANPSSGTSSFSFATNLPTGNFIAIYSGAYKTITSTSFTGSNKESIVFKVTCSGLTAGDSATLDTGSSVFLSFDSEL